MGLSLLELMGKTRLGSSTWTNSRIRTLGLASDATTIKKGDACPKGGDEQLNESQLGLPGAPEPKAVEAVFWIETVVAVRG